MLGRLRFGFRRRVAIGAIALAGLTAALSPAAAVAGTDGTSNTIQYAVASAVLDQAHQRVVVSAPAAGVALGRAPCVAGMDACLMEDDGIWLPGA